MAGSDENEDPNHFLNKTQIKFLKHTIMKNMIRATLDANPTAFLFGGAVRDMVLERHQIGQEYREYDESKSVVSNDLDFCVTTEEDFVALQKFFLDRYHIKPVESNYPGTNFAVYKIKSIPLITGSYLNKELSISVDLVWRRGDQPVDFDVNSLLFNKNGISVLSTFHTSPLESLLRLTSVVQHIKEKTAYLESENKGEFEQADPDSEDDSESPQKEDHKRKLQERAYSLMMRGWKICMQGDDMHYRFEIIPKDKKHKCCGKGCKEIGFIFSAIEGFCHTCWLNK
jgi:hypothetical protein